MRPHVSVVVPVYRAEKYLERCVGSILAQDDPEIEVILVDDGSPDAGGRICDEYAATDPRVTVIHKENGGAGSARNAGIEKATGEYIGFVDSDDSIEQNMYDLLYRAAKKHDADMAFCGMKIVGGKVFDAGEKEDICYALEKEETFVGKDAVNELILGTVGAPIGVFEDSKYGFSACKGVYRTEIFKKYGVRFCSEREFVSEDMLFLVDFMMHIGSAVGVPGAYYRYFRNDGSSSNGFCEDRFEKELKLNAELVAKLSRIMPREKYEFYLDRQLLAYARGISSQEVMHAIDTKMKRSELKKRLLSVCSCDAVQTALKRFPYRALPKAQALFAFAVKYRLTGLQILFVKLRRIR